MSVHNQHMSIQKLLCIYMVIVWIMLYLPKRAILFNAYIQFETICYHRLMNIGF